MHSFSLHRLRPNFDEKGTKQMSSSRLYGSMSIADKYFQLEELEDKETATTEVFLKPDNTVEFGETDGPIPESCTGTWSLSDSDAFTMTITRTFGGGKENTDMGEFSFEVIRTFAGEIAFVGAAAAVTGSMFAADDKGDTEVGYFNMIDTTDERLYEDNEDA